ncbi:hypothetical protein CGLO_13976 [Colletotrichum gloeosporioides Cg-14]|uniref:Uncharacterized protein n=1 Tax=Colletotrichum gloeosporioides (strain Cg-14) TaxID=1237896 RepID=T0LFA6_COLGC|nr:hypothetical protein CGLO_13976 [Colletotrichum gloeosporioides Cg-14]
MVDLISSSRSYEAKQIGK